jgi:hypothetical protein
MGKLSRYRAILRRVIEDYLNRKPANGQIESEAFVDPVLDRYEVMRVGWDRDRRIHGAVIHLDIINGEVWIQYDGTNRTVADEMIAAGIPQKGIVLAFHLANPRPLTGFSVG